MKDLRLRLMLAMVVAALTSAAPGQGQTPPEAGSGDMGRRALARAQKATGGRAKLESIRDLTRTADLVQADSGTRASQVVRVMAPRVIHLTSEATPGLTITAFFDGTRSWASSPWGTDDPLPAWQARAAAQDLLRQLEFLLLSDHDPGRTVDSLGRTEIQGRPAEGIRIVDKHAGQVKLWIDAASGEPVMLEYPRVVSRGDGPLVTDLFSDFREVAGIRMPFKIVSLSDGAPYMETIVAKVEYNTGLTLADLAKKDAPAK